MLQEMGVTCYKCVARFELAMSGDSDGQDRGKYIARGPLRTRARFVFAAGI